MNFRQARKIVANHLDRVATAQSQMAGIGAQPDIFRVSQIQHPARFFLTFNRAPDMGMGGQAYAHGNGLFAQGIQRVGQALELIVDLGRIRPVGIEAPILTLK